MSSSDAARSRSARRYRRSRAQRAMANASLDRLCDHRRPSSQTPLRSPCARPRRDDLAAIMAIERSPDYERYVGRSEEAEHRAMLASPPYAYRLGVGAGGAVEAFAILARPRRSARATSTSSASPSPAPARASARRSSASFSTRRSGRWAPSASISTASPTMPAPRRLTRNSASPATACCARPTAWPTGRGPTSP